MQGYKTIVLTIDPAKRLADSLGIQDLTDTPRQIDLKDTQGEMWAMMLDIKRTFDRIVERYAPSAEVIEQIYANNIYRHMSQMLAGTQEYMAMERLYDIHQQGEYDIIILDTPPTQNAMDFLAAPQRMINLINNSILDILMKPTVFIGKSGLKVIEKGTRRIVKIFDKIAGVDFLQDISEMFIAFSALLGGFESRAELVGQLLAHPSCRFISVCTTTDNSLSEARNFRAQLEQFHYHLDQIIINRIYAGQALANPDDYTAELSQYFSAKESRLLLDNYRKFLPLIKNDQDNIMELTHIFGRKNITTVPLFLSDVHDLDSLKKVSAALS